MMQIKSMVNDRILVKRDPPETKIGEFLTQESNEKQASTGTVVMVGPDAYQAQPGQRILVARFAGNSCQHNGEEHWIMFGKDIHAILEDEVDPSA